MPAPGVPNNPGGVNNFNHFAPEPAYGEALQQQTLQRAAPLAGQQTPSPMNAPKRAQRNAAKQAPVEPPVVTPQTPQLSGQAQVAAFWQQVAQTPGASPLVQQLAVEAQRG